MALDIQMYYQTITKTFSSSFWTPALASLPNNTTAISLTIFQDDLSERWIGTDINIQLKTTTTTSDGMVTLYLLRTLNFIAFDTDGPNAQILGKFKVNTPSTTYRFSVDMTNIGTLPPFYKLGLRNDTGGALASGFSDNVVYINGKKFETL